MKYIPPVLKANSTSIFASSPAHYLSSQNTRNAFVFEQADSAWAQLWSLIYIWFFSWVAKETIRALSCPLDRQVCAYNSLQEATTVGWIHSISRRSGRPEPTIPRCTNPVKKRELTIMIGQERIGPTKQTMAEWQRVRSRAHSGTLWNSGSLHAYF